MLNDFDVELTFGDGSTTTCTARFSHGVLTLGDHGASRDLLWRAVRVVGEGGTVYENRNGPTSSDLTPAVAFRTAIAAGARGDAEALVELRVDVLRAIAAGSVHAEELARVALIPVHSPTP